MTRKRLKARRYLPAGKTYDEFFASKSPVNSIQFWGLVILGLSLIASSLGLLIKAVFIFGNTPSRTDGIFAILIVSSVSLSIGYFGYMHVKRAFRGKR
jgi:hypothetical protein